MEEFFLFSKVRDWCPVLNPFDKVCFEIIHKFGGDFEKLPCYDYSQKVVNICVPAEGKVEKGKIMIVGQNPGKEEDEMMRPFVGPSGKFLTDVLKELGYKRNEFYITNAVKCFMDTERISASILKTCAYCILRREILMIKPSVVICLGRIAFYGVQYALLGNVVEEFERGKSIEIIFGKDEKVKVCCAYHPSYAGFRASGYAPTFSKDLSNFLKQGRYEISYTVLRSYEQVERFVDSVVNGEREEILLFIDVEATSVDCYDRNTDILCIAFAEEWDKGYVVPLKEYDVLRRKLRNFYVEGEQEKVIEKIKELLLHEKVKLVGHNLKYDLVLLERIFGINLVNKIHTDTMVMHFLLKEEPPHGLKELVELYTPFVNYYNEMHDLFKSSKERWYERVDYERLWKYCAYDVCVTCFLYGVFKERLEKLDELQKSMDVKIKEMKRKYNAVGQHFITPYYFNYTIGDLWKMSNMYYKILYKAERVGVPFSRKYINELKKELEKEIKQKIDRLNEISKTQNVNWNSTKQISQVFKKLNISSPILTKKGNESYNEEALKLLAEKGVVLAKELLEYRELFKNYSTYVKIVDNYLYRAIEVDDDIVRINTHIKVVGTETGRPITVDPAVQTFPRNNKFRNMVQAEKGWLIVSADYSMADLRCIAGYSGCKSMLEAFEKGYDFHSYTAAKIFKKDLGDITPEERSVAKNINFSIAYLISADGLAKRYGLEEKFAKKCIEEWFSDKIEVKKFFDVLIEKYKRANVGEEVVYANVFGRCRRLRRVSSNDSSFMHNIRSIINFYPQSTVSDVLMLGTLRFVKLSIESDLQDCYHILFPVHDALLLEVKEEKVDLICEILKKGMEFDIEFPCARIKLPVEFTIDRVWKKA